MNWEIVASNLFTAALIGGCVVGYNFYKKYKELQYYMEAKNQAIKALNLASKFFIQYAALKCGVDTGHSNSVIDSLLDLVFQNYKKIN